MDSELESLLSTYKPNQLTINLMRQIKTVLLVGISCAGKDTLKTKLIKTNNYHDIVSHTTRPPRKNGLVMEKNGVDYYFISKPQAKTMLQKQLFVEAKWVHRQNVYGTAAQEFKKCLSKNKIAIADVEVQGVEEYMKLAAENVTAIFLLPPSYDVWLQRFRLRYEGNMSAGEFSERQKTAKREIKNVLDKNYFSIIINDNIEESAQQVETIVNGASENESTVLRSTKVAQHLLDEIHASTH